MPRRLYSRIIRNPFNERDIKNTASNRRRIQKKIISIVAKEANRRIDSKQLTNNLLTIFGNTQPAPQPSRSRRQRRKEVAQYQFTYKVVFGAVGIAQRVRGNDRVDNFEDSNGVNYNAINRPYICASKRKIDEGVYTDIEKILKQFGNDRLMSQYQLLMVSSPPDAVKIYEERALPKVNPRSALTDKMLYQSEKNVAVVSHQNIFDLTIDKDEKSFKSSASEIQTIKNGCWYNALLNLGERINKGYKSKKSKKRVSEAKIRELCGTQGRSDYGMTIAEASKFFEYYNISLKVYDAFFKRIYDFERTKTERHKVKSFSCLIYSDHLYPILNQNVVNSLSHKQNTDDFELKVSCYYNTKMPKLSTDTLFISRTVDEVFGKIFSTDTAGDLTILYDGNLLDIVKRLMLTHGVTPMVSGQMGSFSSVCVVAGEQTIRIYNLLNQTISRQTLENLTVDQYKNYIEDKNRFTEKIINDKLKSFYSPSLQTAFQNYRRSPIKGLLENVDIRNLKKIHGLDSCKSYATLLSKIEHIPVFSIFDDWVHYDGAELRPTNFYALELVKQFAGFELIFEKDNIIVCGNTVHYLQKFYPETYKIHGVITPYKTVDNPLYGKTLREYFEDDSYSIELKKFNINALIGTMGKLWNRRNKMVLSTDEQYILNLCQNYGEYCVDNIPQQIDEEIFAYYTERMTQLKNGFHPLQFLIYSLQRLTAMMSYRYLQMKGAQCVAVNTDCIYYKPDDKVDACIERDFDGTFGSKKLEKTTMKYFTSVRDANDDTLDVESEDESDADDCGVEPFAELFKEFKQNIITLDDEYDLDEVKRKAQNFTLFTAELPGSGKSYAMQQICDKKKTLFITPYNTLALKLRAEDEDEEDEEKKKGYNATTKNKLLGQGIDSSHTFKGCDITDYDTIVFEEIYCYDIATLRSLFNFMMKHPDKKFYANGDTFQIESINCDASFQYIDKAIRKIFPNNINFKIHKRDPKAHEMLMKLKWDIFESGDDLLEIAKRYFPTIDFEDIDSTQKVVCYFNDSCMKVNTKIHGDNPLRVGDTVLCKAHLSKGGRKMNKNYTYRIVEFLEDDKVSILEPFENQLFIIKQHTLFNNFRYAYSETVHSVQGQTYKQDIVVCDLVENPCMTKRWLWVALTRSSDIKRISLCLKKLHTDRIMNLDQKLRAYEAYDLKRFGTISDGVRCNKRWLSNKIRKQQGVCPHCHKTFKTTWNFAQDLWQYSINRIDNDRGHYEDNCEVTCLRCNLALK